MVRKQERRTKMSKNIVKFDEKTSKNGKVRVDKEIRI